MSTPTDPPGRRYDRSAADGTTYAQDVEGQGRGTQDAGGPAVGTAVATPEAARGGALLSSPVLIGLLAGTQAVLGSLLCVLAPVMATWLVASGTGATWDDALRVAADGWLLAQGAVLAVPGGRLGLWPLGLALLPVLWCVSAGRRTAVALEATHPAGRARRGGLDATLVAAAGGVVLAAVVLAVVVALVAGSSTVRPALGATATGAALVAGASAGLAMASARLRLAAAHPRRSGEVVRPGRGRGSRDARATSLRRALADLVRLPRAAREVAAAGGRSLLWCLVGAAAVLAVALVAGAGQVVDLHRALDAGPVGGVVLLAGQLVLLPTALVWALAWTAGPGFAVGEGTSVTPGGTDLGALPALPLLGGLPQQGTGGGALWVVLLLPVAAGAVAVLRLRLSPPLLRPVADPVVDGDAPVLRRLGAELARRWRPALLRATGVALVPAVGAALLAAASSGPAGPGALDVVGPGWWQTGGAVGCLVLLGAALVLLVPGRPRRAAAAGPPPAGARRSEASERRSDR